MSYQGILFDLDGVLIDSLRAWKLAVVRAGRKRGFYLSYPEADELIHSSIGYEELLRRNDPNLAKKLGIFEGFREAILEEYILSIPAEVRLFHGVREMIIWCKLRFDRVALVTASSRIVALPALQKLGIERFFHAIVTRDDVPRTKPHPDPYLRAIELCYLDPKRTLVVEDTKVGITSGLAAGLEVIGLGKSYGLEHVIDAGAHHAASDHEELSLLLDILHSLGKRKNEEDRDSSP